jgi:hypothetical protein
MKRLNEPTLTFEQVTIHQPKPRTTLWDWFRKRKTSPIHFLGRHTWNRLELQFDSIDEVEFGKRQIFEDDLWLIDMLVTEVDEATLKGIAYINNATRKYTSHA